MLQQNSITPPVRGQVIRYAVFLMQKYDKNGDELLEQSEWDGVLPAPQAADLNGDKKITLEELVFFLANFGKDKTIHKPNVAAPANERKVDPANLKLFRSVIAQPVQSEIKMDKTAEKPADDVSDKTLEDNKPIDDAVYEEIMRNRPASAAKRYHTLPETLQGVPTWFLMRDADGDGQISLAEFAPSLAAQSLALFGKLDTNGNGFIEPEEVKKK
ncbi:hypothetical protein FACS189419_09630 [Planctomycetales bacterium]|nr:hypothetical protein FACS189419_09630 [Planctomycetales bacterium]